MILMVSLKIDDILSVIDDIMSSDALLSERNSNIMSSAYSGYEFIPSPPLIPPASRGGDLDRDSR
jgi:hypothetical protein